MNQCNKHNKNFDKYAYNFFKKTLIVLSTVLITGCDTLVDQNRPSLPVATAATRVIEKPTYIPPKLAPTKAQFLMQQSSDIRKAYQIYEKTGRAPTISTSDFLQFPYGDSQPLIYCQPIHSCDIELEAGETITGVFPGDSARWKYEQGVSGEGEQKQPHLIFKPTDYDISTNVVIATTRRTYHVGLVSKQDSYVKQVKFWYPGDIQAYWTKINTAAAAKWQEQNQTQIAELPNISINKLDFNYSFTKPLFASSPTWAPIRVFNDGAHVYIQMPASVSSTNAPALFVINSDGQKALVNYRVRGGYYIVDQLFKQAVLVTGVGNTQERITISYNS